MSWAAADRRDIDKINNPMSVAELQTYAPGLDWDAYFTASSIATRDRVIVNEKTAIRDISAIYAQTPLATLKAWEAFHVADQAAPYLSSRFVDSRFTFTKTISGVSALRPWCVEARHDPDRHDARELLGAPMSRNTSRRHRRR